MGWVAWGSDCYVVPDGLALYWRDAERYCEQLAGSKYRGSLASIHSYMENKLIYDLLIEQIYAPGYYRTAYIGFTQVYGKYNFILFYKIR